MARGKYQKKGSGFASVLKIMGKTVLTAVGTVIILASTLVTWKLFENMVYRVGGTAATTQTTVSEVKMMDKLDMFITNQISEALDGIWSVEKVYWLSDADLVAPEPDQSKFGETDDPATLQWLLDEAAELLDGQTTYFSTDTKIWQGTKVRYYLDDTILVITWKEIHNYSVYTMSEVKIAHPSQFRRFLAGGEYGSEKQFITSEMAASVNAVVASSGDFYGFRNFGTRVYMGHVYRVNGKNAHTLYIDDQGDFHFTYGGDIMTVEQGQQFVDQHNIRFSLSFGPVLIDNGVRCEPTRYELGQIEEEYARAAICQMDSLHYMMVAANGEGYYQGVPDIHKFAEAIAGTGAKMAYALDGGQTAVIVMNDQVINRVVYGYQRRISDIIYFATAIPDGGGQ